MSSLPGGVRGLKAATATGLSARSVKVELAGLAKSAWKSNSRKPGQQGEANDDQDEWRASPIAKRPEHAREHTRRT